MSNQELFSQGGAGLTPCYWNGGQVADTLNASESKGTQSPGYRFNVCITGDVTHPLKGEGHDGSEDGTGRGTPVVAFNMRGRQEGNVPEVCEKASVRAASGGSTRTFIATPIAVRRLTPTECERLQGFPDDHTSIPYGRPRHEDQLCPDGPRYKALGNSMAVPVVRRILKRIVQGETQ